MNKFLALAILLLFSILSQYGFTDSYSLHLSKPQHFVLDDTKANDFFQLDDDEKSKNKLLFISALTIIIMIVQTLSLLKALQTKDARRFVFLTPIFHQSNYVDTTLLNRA